MTMQTYVEAFFKELGANPDWDKDAIAKRKVALCKAHGVVKIPTDIELFLLAPNDLAQRFRKTLQTKPNRSLSGVAPLAIMTSPARCPHGKCRMCPGGIASPWGDIPQSYTGAEPATMRGLRADFDPYLQVMNRLEQYIVTGHIADKIDLIVMGGTFPARDTLYQTNFIAFAFKAMNDFSDLFFHDGEFALDSFKEFFELPGQVGSDKRTKRIHEKLLARKGEANLSLEQKRNETAAIRCIGLTIETKPDWAMLKEGNRMLAQGCTRVELGVQSLYDKPLELIQRGHTVQDNVDSIAVLKDLGFKINYHIMIGLPGTSKDHDIEMFKTLFADTRFRPDMLKIYPCMVMPGTELENDYDEGLFKPISTEDAAQIIAQAMQYVPTYCRVMRVQRDIPTYRTTAGVARTNLRQYVDEVMKRESIVPRDIRAREAGRKEQSSPPDIKLNVLKYEASEGTEFFLSFDDEANDVLLGFCRLRFPKRQLRDEFAPNSAIVRELHVYGSAVGIGDDDESSAQHKGFGKQLIAKAEQIARESFATKILVIAGVGVREYYKKLGYVQDGPYVSKVL